MTTHRYWGHPIYACKAAAGAGAHRGRWIVQSYHKLTGLPWADQECPHFTTLAAPGREIRAGARGPHPRIGDWRETQRRTTVGTFEIVAAVGEGANYGTRGGDWDPSIVGSTNNEFASIEEAEDAIEALLALGDDWADGAYAIREIGARYPEPGVWTRDGRTR